MHFILALLVGLSPYLYARDCFPPNQLSIQPSAKGGIDQAQFNMAIALIERVYTPIVRKAGGNLRIHKLWSNPTVNATAYRTGSTWHVDAFGGLARFPGMTYGAFLVVMCHEVGHHIGGSPRYDRDTDWASVEGQADYFATRYCMRKLGLKSDRAGLAVATVMAKLGGEARLPRPDTPDTSIVNRTYESHPKAQCRLDTYRRGVRDQDRPLCWFKP